MILVFGSGGQVGQEIARAAGRMGIPLTGLPHDDVDIVDKVAVRRAIGTIRPRLVVNAAAYTRVDRAEREPEAARRANAEGPAVIAEICAASGLPLIHLSTDYVFDGRKGSPYSEDDAVAPLGIYGRSKADGEAAVRRLCLRHLIVRTAWVYGRFGRNFLKTVLKLAARRDEFGMVADQWGSPTAAADLAAAILATVPQLANGLAPWGTYHFAGAGSTTWYGLACRIVAAQAPVTGRRPQVVPIAAAEYPTAAPRPANSALDSTRFATVFGVRPRAWEEAVDATVADLLAVEAAA